ncbi:PDZ domain-containing protein [Acanthopleuribacter pedis]|uniref:PDZ domain-containing protein n=1 Tax=Acanthopleuribacter pedis TaxID=442870 RepID=A0A8J7Q826_9BACT|nr:PDZ domain-containing protein [Acanthopleuribacter pedis]MBO1320146.1 PDZ domain-containing protein [Acanthopleuribacter pedis]
MKRHISLAVLAIVSLAFSGTLFAGEGHKCSAESQTCLNAMVEKFQNKGWLGVELDWVKDSKALKVKRVIEASPAAAAGLKSGDVLVALNGVKYGDKEGMKSVYAQVKPGNTVTYTIKHGAKERKVDVKLGTFPEELAAKYIGMHLMEQHATAVAVN